MIELRKDYILDRWSYIALGRGKRPSETEIKNADNTDAVCYFCPGSENLTPPEIGRIGSESIWQERWFPNKFPAVEPNMSEDLSESEEFFHRESGFGYHEVIAETSVHNDRLCDLSVANISDLLQIYSHRINELGKKKSIRYVQVFKNSGAQAGTSIAHSHSQIIAGTLVPKYVQEKVNAAKKYKSCPYCDIIKKEEKSDRMIFANESFIAFTTFAPRFNYEVMIFPKKHFRNMNELDEKKFDELAEVFQKILKKLGEVDAPYNYFLHYAPKGEDLHFHFEINPRLNTWAGFELATDSFIITTSPEEAAAYYREIANK